MKIDINALGALELKLAEFSKKNGPIADHQSKNSNACTDCYTSGGCKGTCRNTCMSKCSASSSRY